MVHAVRAAAERLDAAVDSFEQAEQQYNDFQKRSMATLERLRKLRAKPGERSARWTREWLAQCDQMEAEEERLNLELERQEAIVGTAQLLLDAAMSSAKKYAMGGPMCHPPLRCSAELEPGLAIQTQKMDVLDDQQLAALNHESSLKEEEAWQHEISLISGKRRQTK